MQHLKTAPRKGTSRGNKDRVSSSGRGPCVVRNTSVNTTCICDCRCGAGSGRNVVLEAIMDWYWNHEASSAPQEEEMYKFASDPGPRGMCVLIGFEL